MTISDGTALTYAEIVAREFGVGENRTVDFDKSRARDDVKREGDAKKTKKAKERKAEPNPEA